MAMQHPDAADLRPPLFDPYDLAATTVGEAMTAETVAVRDDAPVDSVRALFLERGIGGAPVVGQDGKLLGVIALADLARHDLDGDQADVQKEARRLSVRTRLGYAYGLPAGFHEDTAAQATAADAMTPFAFVLPEDASLAQAAALMAYEGISRIVIVGGDGRACGMLTALDVTSFLARRLGLMPRHAETPDVPSRRGVLTRERGLVSSAQRPSLTRAVPPAPRESGEFEVSRRRDVA